MRTTTFKCDRCGDSWDLPGPRRGNKVHQHWTIHMKVSADSNDYGHWLTKAEWCRACLAHFGIVPRLEDSPAPEPVPTLEDLIRAIVREENDG